MTRELPELPLFAGWRVPIWTVDDWRRNGTAGSDRLSEAQLRYLAGFGVLAPTTHNTIPERFELLTQEGALLLFIDREFVLPESDRDGRQALVSLGCVITNIELAARVFGRSTEIELLAEGCADFAPLQRAQSAAPRRYAPLAKLRFPVAESAISADWIETLIEHKVVRAEYDASVALPPPLIETVHRVVREVAPAPEMLQAHVLTGALPLRALGKFQEQADRFVLENQRFAEELGRWLLPNSDVTATRAMRGTEFGFDDTFAEHVHRGLTGQGRLLPDQVAAFAKGGKVGIESSSAVIVLSTDSDEVPQRLATGRACHHISLEMQRAGFASAYHAALTEVEWVARMFSATLLRTLRRPMALLRVGRPKRASDWQRPPAARPTLEDLLLT